MSSNSPSITLKALLRLHSRGLSILPTNTEKKPNVSKWKELQTVRATQNQITEWYNQSKFEMVAILTGQQEDGLFLTCLDFDNKFPSPNTAEEIYSQFQQMVNDHDQNLFQKLTVETSMSGGYHIFFKSLNEIHNEKLSNIGKVAVIETRGQGGYAVTNPTPNYNLIQKDLHSIPYLDSNEVEMLMTISKQFGETTTTTTETTQTTTISTFDKNDNNSNTDIFQLWQDSISVNEAISLLESDGWRVHSRQSNKIQLTRPGKKKGTSATFFIDSKILYVFTSSTDKKPETSISLQENFISIKYGGDRDAFYRELFQQYKPKWNFTDKKISYSIPKQKNEVAERKWLNLNQYELLEKIKRKDFGEAELCELYFNQTRKFDANRKRWFIYHNGLWEVDKSNAFLWEIYHFLNSLYNDFLKLLREELKQIDPKTKPDEFKSKKEQTSMVQQRYSYIQTFSCLASSSQAFQSKANIDSSLWNSKKHFLNFRNGVYDMQNFEFIKHNPNQHLTFQMNYDYNAEDVDSYYWVKFLYEIFDQNKEMVNFMQKLCGIWATGEDFQKFIFAYGGGANGKSLFFNAVKMVLNGYENGSVREFGYCSNFDIMNFSKQNSGNQQAKYSLAKLQGVRFSIGSELPPSLRLNENLLKDITGGESIEAREIFGSPFTFKPQFKLAMFGNSKPTIKDNSYGFWRRFLLIPFEVTIAPEKRKPMNEMLANFWSESSAIMNWFIEGYRKLIEEGLNEPSQVIAKTSEFKLGEDVVQQFLDEYEKNESGRILFKDFLLAFTQNYEKISRKRFREELESRGIYIKEGNSNKLTVYGYECKQS